jgi:hypothetical protein
VFLDRREVLKLSLSLGGCGVRQLHGEDKWPDKKPEEWTPADTHIILNDSAWVRPARLLMDSSALADRAEKDNRRVPTEFAAVVRWESGLPVRLARRTASSSGTPQYLLSISRLPLPYMGGMSGRLPGGAASGEGVIRTEIATQMAQTARLERLGKEPIAATGAVWLEIAFAQAILISFPHGPQPISLQDGEVTLAARAGSFTLSTRFPLHSMVYRGKLEL